MATVANPAPAKKTTKTRKKDAMATTKKGKKPKKKNPGNPGPKTAKKRAKRRNPGGSATPRGMVLVPASMVGPVATAAKKKRKSSHKRPRRHNPGNPDGAHHPMKDALAAVGFGSAAALIGILGGYALSKANLESKGANVAANIAAGTLVGGGLGMLDRTAGTIVAHNYMVAAGQWMASPSSSSSDSSAGQGQNTRALRGGASPRMMANARRAASAKLNGISADTFGGMEPLQAISADTFGDAEDVGGMEPLQGISADTFGDPEVDGFEELGDMNDEMGDPFDFGDSDEMGDTDDVGDPLGDLV